MDVLLLDLDETLYPRGAGVLERTDARIVAWIRERLGLPLAEADRLRHELFRAHGTTLRGLVLRHGLEPGDYLETVYGCDHSDLLRPDPELRALLARLPQRKVVFTNAPRRHAEHVLDLLALGDVLHDVIALEDLDLVPKPDPAAYATALARVAAPAEACVFVDDTHANVVGAARAGMRAVWVAHGRPPPGEREGADHHVIDALHELEALLAR